MAPARRGVSPCPSLPTKTKETVTNGSQRPTGGCPGYHVLNRGTAAAEAIAAEAAGAGEPVVRSVTSVRNPGALRGGPSSTHVYEEGHNNAILCIAVHPSQTSCATGSADSSLRIFGICREGEEGGGLLRKLDSPSYRHNDWVSSCAYTPDGQLLSGGLDGKVLLWNLSNENMEGGLRERVRTPMGAPPSLAPAKEGPPAAAFSRINATRKTGLAKRTLCREIGRGHRAGVSQVLVKGSSLGMTSGYDGCLRLWDLDRGRQICELSAVDTSLPGALEDLSPLLQFVCCNSFAAAGSRRGDITIWDVNTEQIACRVNAAHKGAVGELLLLLPQHTDASADAAAASSSSSCCCISGSVSLLISGGRGDGRLCIFDPRILPSAVCTAQAHTAALNAILSIGSCCVATLGADGYSRLWDVRMMGGERERGRNARRSAERSSVSKALSSIKGGKGGYLCGVCIDDEEGLICGGSTDGAVYLLDVVKGKICWGYGCDSTGAVHAIKPILIPKQDRDEESVVFTSVAVVAGGDDGQLALIRFA